jgi:hypothetical protein
VGTVVSGVGGAGGLRAEGPGEPIVKKQAKEGPTEGSLRPLYTPAGTIGSLGPRPLPASRRPEWIVGKIVISIHSSQRLGGGACDSNDTTNRDLIPLRSSSWSLLSLSPPLRLRPYSATNRGVRGEPFGAPGTHHARSA